MRAVNPPTNNSSHAAAQRHASRPSLPPRTYLYAGLCTFALFTVAAWASNGIIGLVPWIIAAVLGLPVSILERAHARRFSTSNAPRASAVLPVSLRVFGGLSLFLGAGIVAWQLYDYFVRRLPTLVYLNPLAQGLLALVLIGFGYVLLFSPLRGETTDGEPAREAI